MSEIIYDLKNAGVCYRRMGAAPWRKNKVNWAFKDVTFSAFKCETIGIIGRNGAGKSTLLRLLAGIISPDIGTFSKAKVGSTMLSLGAGFDPRLTGFQNIFLNGLLLGMTKSQINRKLNDIFELAGLGDAIFDPVKTYSTGMYARLGFAIAFYVDTEVILIDETFAPGDQEFCTKATMLIKNKIREHTVIIVSHSMPLIQELCDRAIHIEHGNSLPEMTVDQTVERYLALVSA